MDSWICDQENIEELANELMHKLNQRNQYSTVTHSYAKSDLHIKDLYKQFQQKLLKLEENLNSITSINRITQRESDRRLRLIDMLKNRSNQIQNMIANPNSDRRNLFGGQAYQSNDRDVPSISWNDLDTETGSSNIETNGKSVSELRQTQQILIEEQDDGLDTLTNIVQRQKYAAQGINTEIDLHNEIIEDIGEALLENNDRVMRNTRNIRRVDRKTNTCGYWILIILLFIAILVTAFIPI